MPGALLTGLFALSLQTPSLSAFVHTPLPVARIV